MIRLVRGCTGYTQWHIARRLGKLGYRIGVECWPLLSGMEFSRTLDSFAKGIDFLKTTSCALTFQTPHLRVLSECGQHGSKYRRGSREQSCSLINLCIGNLSPCLEAGFHLQESHDSSIIAHHAFRDDRASPHRGNSHATKRWHDGFVCA
jgi:hypothetical protein